MAVTTPEKRWTDERLDDLDAKVDAGYAEADKKMDAGFARVDANIRELRGEVGQRFDTVEGKIESGIKDLRGELNGRIDQVGTRVDRLLYCLLIAAAFGVIAAIIGSNAL